MKSKPLFDPRIIDRLQQPTPGAVRAARKAADLSQMEAAELVSTATKAQYKTWGSYEFEESNPNHRKIPLATWELFLLLTGQHPTLCLGKKKAP